MSEKELNRQELDILCSLFEEPFQTQRKLVERSGYSLGLVNKILHALYEKAYLTDDYRPTKKAERLKDASAVRSAVILAAGFGMKMAPLNKETPKGLIAINGEALIDRTIEQLHEAGVFDIYVVVGFMKECFEYLTDQYGVTLIVNEEYASKNNICSLYRAKEHLAGSYIIPCDIWCRNNPYKSYELYSWYMLGDEEDEIGDFRANRKNEVVKAALGEKVNRIIGLAYLDEEDAEKLITNMDKLTQSKRGWMRYWEDALFDGDRFFVDARVERCQDYVELVSYDQVEELNGSSRAMMEKAIEKICEVFQVSQEEIQNVEILKNGLTNRSFLFSIHGERYVMRIPGVGTSDVDRVQEALVYRTLDGKEITEPLVYIDESGYKITKYISNSRNCDPRNKDDLKMCMTKLREMHKMGLQVSAEYNLFDRLLEYEDCWPEKNSVYKDYEETKKNILSLRPFAESHTGGHVLAHMDCYCDNFLIEETSQGAQVYLIDWEYSGMSDPHSDLGVFCVSSDLTPEEADAVIDAYYPEGCSPLTRLQIYSLIATNGLGYSNWCEYKMQLGVEFSEVSIKKYRSAKLYYRLCKEKAAELGIEL